MKLRVLGRLLEIQRVLVRHGLDDFVRATHLYRPLRFLFYLSPWTWFQRRRGANRAERLRLALEELGPIFVKFGQALSTRRDLLPPDIEAAIAQVAGRVPAHLATRAFLLFASWGRAASESVARNTADYLAHESRDLVPRAEAEGYFSGVEGLRSAVTRAELRVAQLAERLATLTVRGAS